MSRKKSDTLNGGISMDEEALMGFKKGNKPEKSKEGFDVKIAAFVSIGALSFVYVIGELGVAIWLNSLVLLSDGFHNLSDVVSLYIAYWAQNAQKRDSSQDMSYGWARTEILGGLTNGCFLLSLCLYVVLESIPKFIRPEPIEGGFWFMITAGIGLAVNTIGTIVFCITGQGHGHSHSHGHGHGHGHGHEHKDKSKKEKKDHKEDKHKEEKLSLLDSDGIEEVEIKKEKKKKENGHGHSHSHSHKEGKDKEGKKKEGHEHGHSHGHKDKKKKKKDMNVHAVFLHFLGDAISSVMVLIAGALIHFFDGAWVLYIDAVSSLLIVGIILWTTIPLVKRCSMILLQSTPNDLDVEAVRIKLLKVTGVVSLHDFHVWQLIDGMVITSLHVGVEEGADFSHVITDMKKILHEYGIHSTSVQPEFVPRSNRPADFCEQNCVKECEEDWCCKKPSERKRTLLDEYSTSTEL